MQASPRRVMSEAEFLRLPETNTYVELLDGEVVVSPSPTYWHQELVIRIAVALRAWAVRQKRPVTVAQGPLDVRFGPSRILQPEVLVLFAAVPRRHRGPLTNIPELCVEVLSEDRVYDRVTKRLLYAAAGVREYWVVDPDGVVEKWTGDELDQRTVVRARLTTALLPGFSLDVRKLFVERPR